MALFGSLSSQWRKPSLLIAVPSTVILAWLLPVGVVQGFPSDPKRSSAERGTVESTSVEYGPTTITNDIIKSSFLLYRQSGKVLSLFLLSEPHSQEEARDLEPRKKALKTTLFSLDIQLHGGAERLTSQSIKKTQSALPRKEDGEIILRMDSASQVTLDISGKLEDGAPIKISSQGSMPESSDGKRPPYQWDFDTTSAVVFLK